MTGHVERIAIAGVTESRRPAGARLNHVSVSLASQGGPKIAATV